MIAIILPSPANMLGHVTDLVHEQEIQLNHLLNKNNPKMISHCSCIWLAIICMEHKEHCVHTYSMQTDVVVS